MSVKKIRLAVIGSVGRSCDIHFTRRLKNIDQNKYDITIISPTYYLPSTYEGIEVFSVDISLFSFLRHFQFFYHYFLFIRKKKFDLIYIFGGLISLGWLATIASKCPYIITVIGYDVFLDDQIKTTFILRKNAKRFFRGASYITSLSLAMDKRLCTFFEIEKERIIRDFLDIEDDWYQKNKILTQQSFNDAFPIILSPRMLQPLYQQDKIIEALPMIKEYFPKILLLQTGFGQKKDFFEKCQKLTNRLHLENHVCFLESFKKTTDLIGFFDICDLVIMIPKSDGMPSTLVEAWARKKPVIVSDIDNYDNADNNRLYIKTNTSPEDIARTVGEIMNNSTLKETIVSTGIQYLEKIKNNYEKLSFLKQVPLNKQHNFFNRVTRFFWFLTFILEPLFHNTSQEQ